MHAGITNLSSAGSDFNDLSVTFPTKKSGLQDRNQPNPVHNLRLRSESGFGNCRHTN